MTGLDTSAVAPEPYRRPLYVSIELAANLVYLARQADATSARHREYLEQLSAILTEMRDHPAATTGS